MHSYWKITTMLFHKNTLALAVMAASLCAAVSGAVAESGQYDSPTLLGPVTVKATRSNQTLESVAASVTVVTDQELEADLAEDMSDVFEYIPGITINDSNRQGVKSINIRGMGGKRVKIIVDGVSQPGVFDGGRYEFINSSAVSVDVDMIKRVEVVKGAASSLQGSDAIGGIVAFETKGPADFLQSDKNVGGQVKLSYASRTKSLSEHAVVAKRFGGVDAMVAYTRRDGKQLENFAGTPTNSYSVSGQDYSKNDLLIKVQSQLNDQHRLEFTGEIIHNQTDSDVFHKSYQNVKGNDTNKQETVAVKHLWFADSLFADTITSRLSWLAKEENGVTRRFQPASAHSPHSMPTLDNQQKKDYYYNEDKIEFETQFDKVINNHSVVYGLSIKSSDISNINTEYNSAANKAAVNVITYTPKAKERVYGLYLQDEISLMNGHLTVTPGVRYDYSKTDPGALTGESFEKYSDSAFTSRLGASYKISPAGTFFGQISQGFRAPSFDELYYTFDNITPFYGYNNIPNPNLGAEKSLSYELGYRHNDRHSSSEFAVFHSDYKDFIERVVTGKKGVVVDYSFANIGRATIKGFELSNTLDWHAIAQLPKGLKTRLVAAYTEGKDDNAKPLNSVNPWNAVFAINYDAPSEIWGSSLKVNYTAKKSDSDINSDVNNNGINNQVELPSATIVDLTAYYKPMQEMTIRAGIMNLTNKKYYKWNDVRGLTSLSLDDTQAKRNYGLSVKYEF